MACSEQLEELLKTSISEEIDKTVEIDILFEQINKENKKEQTACRKIFKKYLTIIKNKIKTNGRK